MIFLNKLKTSKRSDKKVCYSKGCVVEVKKRNIRSWQSVSKKWVTLITADGCGPEICDSAVGVIQASKAPIEFERFDKRRNNLPSADVEELPVDLIKSVAQNRVALKGPFYTPPNSRRYTKNLQLRKTFNLSTALVPCKSYKGVKGRHEGVDIVVFRENREGEYSGLENELVPGVVQSLKITTTRRSRAIAEQAFSYAKLKGRKRITAIHKANIQKITDGLFLQACREVAKRYPLIEYKEMIVDNACMQMIMNPAQFDVLLTPNLYGNVMTNVAAGITGGVGFTPGANFGFEQSDLAIFEPGTRHIGMDIAGKNLANPSAMIFSAVMMLRHLGMDFYADNIEKATLKVIEEGKHKTRDIGGDTTTTGFTAAVINEVENINA